MNPVRESSTASLIDNYRPPEGTFDELRDSSGRVRSSWGGLCKTLDELGPAGLGRRVETLGRLIREYGVAYNVYSDDERQQHRWAMDLIPFLLEGSEWTFLETALSQRFHLLNLVLKDCYGPQRLLEGGRLPPDLVVGNPAFLPACHQLLPEAFHHLQVYCADLGRSPDGAWWVLSDRLDAASGLGYAIENRQLSHRVLPEALRQSPVRPIQRFVTQFCQAMERLAPKKSENPNVVFLTPGPHNETYFEHSFLARTLGYPLVEGDDLTVRDSRVFLKTIGGMQSVDVIVRRIDSEWCDPLELRSDSLLGVPGLLQAVRSGNVAVANGIGSGLLQSPGFSAYLGTLCRNLLGEDLKIPSVATWWCGQESALDYVLENLAGLVLKPAKDRSLGAAVFGGMLSAAERDQWRRRLRAQPEEWCGQETVSRATTPSFVGGVLEPNHFLLRVYLIRHQGSYVMMPGGLARAAPHARPSVSMQAGGVSKDVWVSGDVSGMARAAGREMPTPDHIIIRRAAHSLPSRVADNLFWLGRYFERTEAQARLVRALIAALMDEAWGDRGESIARLFSVLLPEEELAQLCAPQARKGLVIELVEAETILRCWFREENVTGGLHTNIRAILRTARGVKELLSLDAWHTMSNLEELAGRLPFVGLPEGDFAALQVLQDDTLQTLNDILVLLSGMSGLSMENMTRGHGWTFQDIGRRIERSLHLCNLIYSTLTPECQESESLLWLLLQCSDSLITYRRRYLTNTHSMAVLDLLVSDPLNPRSLAFQAEQIHRHIATLPHHFESTLSQPMDKTALRLVSHIGLCDVAELNVTARGRRHHLARFLDALAKDLCLLSDQIGAHYFAITTRPTQGKAMADPADL